MLDQSTKEKKAKENLVVFPNCSKYLTDAFKVKQYIHS